MQTPPPTLSRAEWRDHPHFPSQVLLLGSHANFRRINRYLVDEVRGSADPCACPWTRHNNSSTRVAGRRSYALPASSPLRYADGALLGQAPSLRALG